MSILKIFLLFTICIHCSHLKNQNYNTLGERDVKFEISLSKNEFSINNDIVFNCNVSNRSSDTLYLKYPEKNIILSECDSFPILLSQFIATKKVNSSTGLKLPPKENYRFEYKIPHKYVKWILKELNKIVLPKKFKLKLIYAYYDESNSTEIISLRVPSNYVEFIIKN